MLSSKHELAAPSFTIPLIPMARCSSSRHRSNSLRISSCCLLTSAQVTWLLPFGTTNRAISSRLGLQDLPPFGGLPHRWGTEGVQPQRAAFTLEGGCLRRVLSGLTTRWSGSRVGMERLKSSPRPSWPLSPRPHMCRSPRRDTTQQWCSPLTTHTADAPSRPSTDVKNRRLSVSPVPSCPCAL